MILKLKLYLKKESKLKNLQTHFNYLKKIFKEYRLINSIKFKYDFSDRNKLISIILFDISKKTSFKQLEDFISVLKSKIDYNLIKTFNITVE